MKVTVHAGLTFQMGAIGSNQYGRIDVTYADIDTEMPLDEQLAAGVDTAKQAFRLVAQQVSAQAQVLHGTKK